MVTIVAKSLNIDVSNFTRTVECSYFTKQAFVRGEMVDSSFRLIPAHTRSYWRGLAPPPSAEKSSSEDGAESTPNKVSQGSSVSFTTDKLSTLSDLSLCQPRSAPRDLPQAPVGLLLMDSTVHRSTR